MLRLVKWAYDLGVRHERHRIAAYLANAQNQRFNPPELEPLVLSKSNTNERQKRKAALKAAVDREVINIIKDLFREERFKRGESIMFPEGEEK